MSLRSVGMVHLDGYLRAHGGAHGAAGTALFTGLLFLFESGWPVALPVVFRVDLDVLIWAHIHAKMTALTPFLIDYDLPLSGHRRVPRSD